MLVRVMWETEFVQFRSREGHFIDVARAKDQREIRKQTGGLGLQLEPLAHTSPM